MHAFLIVILAAFLFVAAPVNAASHCHQRDLVREQLKAYWNETPLIFGVARAGNLVEILTSPAGETWTIIVIHPIGRACIVITGENLQPVAPSKGSKL